MLFIFVGLTSWRMRRPLSSVDLCSECLPLTGVWPSVLRKTADSVRRIESELLFDLGLSSSSRSMVCDKSGQLNIDNPELKSLYVGLHLRVTYPLAFSVHQHGAQGHTIRTRGLQLRAHVFSEKTPGLSGSFLKWKIYILPMIVKDPQNKKQIDFPVV